MIPGTATTTEQQKSTAIYELKNVIGMGLNIKYICVPFHDTTKSKQEQFDNREKAMKYIRDTNTERGLIKCLHRETKQYCDCMATKNIEAKGMSKMERCGLCQQKFAKKLMKKCDGCEGVVYCSIECCSQDWPRHKIVCETEQPIRAANTMNNAVVIGSQHPSEEESGMHRDGSGGENNSQDGK